MKIELPSDPISMTGYCTTTIDGQLFGTFEIGVVGSGHYDKAIRKSDEKIFTIGDFVVPLYKTWYGKNKSDRIKSFAISNDNYILVEFENSRPYYKIDYLQRMPCLKDYL